jgi:hypothetical protein
MDLNQFSLPMRSSSNNIIKHSEALVALQLLCQYEEQQEDAAAHRMIVI